MKSVFAHGLHYIVNGDSSEELYDVADDPGEEQNLITHLSQAKLSELRALLR